VQESPPGSSDPSLLQGETAAAALQAPTSIRIAQRRASTVSPGGSWAPRSPWLPRPLTGASLGNV